MFSDRCAARIDPWRRRGDQSRDDDKAHVQRSRCRDLGQGREAPVRQPRRARRERVEMEHDETTGKPDTERACAAPSATATQSTAVLPGSPFTTRPASAEYRARVEISPMWRKIPRPAFSKPIVADEPRSVRKDHRSASTTTCWTTDEALPDMAAKYSRNAFGSGPSTGCRLWAQRYPMGWKRSSTSIWYAPSPSGSGT